MAFLNFQGGDWRNPSNYVSDVLSNSPFNPNLQTPPPELLSKNFKQENQTSPQYQPQSLPEYAESRNYFRMPNPDEISIQRNLVGYKTAFKDTGDEIDFYGGLLSSGGLDENQAKEAQNRIGLLKLQQQELNKAADTTRNIARSLGMNTYGFNADNTLEDSQRNLATNYAHAVQNALNPKSVADRQREVYSDALGRGLTSHDARALATHMRGRLSREYQNELMSGFRNLGLNEDGTINPIGEQLLARLADENIPAVELFSNQFASPKNYFQEVQENYRQNLIADRQYQLQDRNQQYDWQKTMATLNAAREQQKDQQEHAIRMKSLDAAKKGTGVAEDKLTQEISSVMRNTGLPQEVATEIVLRQHYSNSFKVQRDADGNIKTSDAEKVTNNTTGRLALMNYYLGKGDFEKAKEFITNYRNAVTSDDFKYAEQLDGEQIISILEILDLGERVANGELTFEEMQAAMNGGRGNSAADLSKVNHDKDANIRAKRIAEENQRKRNNKSQNSTDKSGLVPRIYSDSNGRVSVDYNQPQLLRVVPIRE